MDTIQVRLRELRALRHLSQQQVAAAAGLRPQTVAALERGAAHGIQFATLARLCVARDCAPGDLITMEGNGTAQPRPAGPDEAEIAALHAQLRPMTAAEKQQALQVLEDSRLLGDEILARRGGCRSMSRGR